MTGTQVSAFIRDENETVELWMQTRSNGKKFIVLRIGDVNFHLEPELLSVVRRIAAVCSAPPVEVTE